MAKSYILITRAHQDAIPLAKKLNKRGFCSIIDPLLTINFKTGSEPNLENVQALLMTSANGVRAFAKRSWRRDIPVCAVGDATAREAGQQGFLSIRSASGDVNQLAELIKKAFIPKNGALFHSTGSRLAGNLGKILKRFGFNYHRSILYETREAMEFSTETLEAIFGEKLSSVLFFSPRTAVIFCKLVVATGITDQLNGTNAFCLSDAVAENLSKLRWKKLIVADFPNQSSLLSRLERRI